MFSRSSGVLIHITSLPGPFGIGDLGPSAHWFVDWLAGTRTRYWQILPVGPVGFANSPYASPSSHAGNVDLISPELLLEDGLVASVEPFGDAGRVDYAAVHDFKEALVEEARSRQSTSTAVAFDDFREKERRWLEPYSLFMAIKGAHGGRSWVDWDEDLRSRQPVALTRARRELEDEIVSVEFGQFLFQRQMERLSDHARERGVEIIGDLPLYAATDSVDVWANPELFSIDPVSGSITEVAGVPADPLSPVGQEWGMPTYRWDAHRAEGYRWWLGRVAAALRRADVLRLDHFTGFHRYYAIPPASKNPLDGDWRDGPGSPLFEAIRDRLGDLPLIAEDIGPLLPEVDVFRRGLGLPGIRVLLEAFDVNVDETRRPEGFPEDCVIYTGTHDYDTAAGRLAGADAPYRDQALAYTGGSAETFAVDLVAKAWDSPQIVAVAPVQDLLGLGSSARMNTPGTVDANWEWRLGDRGLLDDVADMLQTLNEDSARAR